MIACRINREMWKSFGTCKILSKCCLYHFLLSEFSKSSKSLSTVMNSVMLNSSWDRALFSSHETPTIPRGAPGPGAVQGVDSLSYLNLVLIYSFSPFLFIFVWIWTKQTLKATMVPGRALGCLCQSCNIRHEVRAQQLSGEASGRRAPLVWWLHDEVFLQEWLL